MRDDSNTGHQAGIPLPSLIDVRKRKLLSQVELATRAGVGRNTVLRLENGAAAQYGTVRKLAEALDVDPVELMMPSSASALDNSSQNGAAASRRAVEQADAAFEAGLSRLMADLQSQYPTFFDESGALRREAILRLLARRARGKKMLTGSELLALTGRGDGRSPDAP